MQTWPQILFYSTFLGQIFLVSWYLPRQQMARMRYVLDNYSPVEYPRLYPVPVEYYRMTLLAYRWANRLVVALGLALMLALIFLVDHSTFADDGYISEAWPLFFAVIQFLPLIVLEISACGQFRLMRRLNNGSVRRAQLVPRRLFDFLSPLTLAVTVLLAIAAVVFDALLNGGFLGPLQRSMGLVFGNAMMVLSVVMMLRGRKPNPHQSAHDRARQISASLTSTVCVSIALSVFHMAGSLDRAFNLDYLDATISSVYVLVIASLSVGYLMRVMTLRPSDFDGYKDDAARV